METSKPYVSRKIPLLWMVVPLTPETEALQLARDSVVIMVSLSDLTTHRLQPLHVAFFRPLNSYYIGETEKWLRAIPGGYVTQARMAMLFGKENGKSSYCVHSNQRLSVCGNMASKRRYISRPSFISFGGEYYCSWLCTASWAELQDEAGTSQANLQWTRNGNTSLLVPQNITSSRSSYCLQY